MIAAVLLAAGRSTRFGGDKLLAPLAGKPVIRWSAETLAKAVDELVVVVPAGDVAIRAALAGVPSRIVENARREEGMSSSLAAGIAAVRDGCDATLVALGDQPGIGSHVVTALVAEWRTTRAAAVAPQYREGRGHPVLFDRRCFGALVALKGDVGARAVLESLGDELLIMRVDEPQPADVDTPDVLERLARDPRPVS